MDDDIRDDELEESEEDDTLELPDEDGDLLDSEEDEEEELDKFGMHTEDEEEAF